MTSKKPAVIEWLFFNKSGFDKKTNTLKKPVMTFDDVVEGIEKSGAELNTSNPANFWKDITRKNPNSYWPAKVFECGWTGRDGIGDAQKACFVFVRVPAGQTTAFPVGRLPSKELLEKAHAIQSLSIPTATKALGRKDENWLAQVGVRLSVIETHFAVFSNRKLTEISFLQTGIKLNRGEVDIAYKAVDGEGKTWVLAVEAKGKSENIHEEQLQRAANALHDFCKKKVKVEIAGVIPMAVKVVDRSLIYTVEYEIDETEELAVTCEGVVALRPDVPGIE